MYPVHDTVPKRYRHLNFFQHEYFLEARLPRVKLPDGAIRQSGARLPPVRLAARKMLPRLTVDPSPVLADRFYRRRSTS